MIELRKTTNQVECWPNSNGENDRFLLHKDQYFLILKSHGESSFRGKKIETEWQIITKHGIGYILKENLKDSIKIV